MKRLTLVAVMAAFLASIATSYAEVQHIRLSGEIRLRAYWTKNLTDLYDENSLKFNDSDTYIAQRTRITVDADVDDNIMVVVTLQARNVWGGDAPKPSSKSDGDDSESDGDDSEPDGDDSEPDVDGSTGFFGGSNILGAQPASIVRLVEAYVRLQEVFWSPLTVTLGRQGLHFGNGLIFSDNDKEYRFDAARFEWDQADNGFKVDFVFAKLVSRTKDAYPGLHGAGAFNFRRDADVYFLNVRWEPKNIKFIENVEGYIGYQAALFGGIDTLGAFDAYIWTFGFRGDVTPLPDNDKAKSWKFWWEIAFQAGTEGEFADDKNGWLLDLGTRYGLENMEWKPVIWAGYTVATGHGSDKTRGNRDFVPWFDYNTRGGFVMSPLLTNIQIWSFGAMASPNDKWAFAASAHRYIQDRANVGTAILGYGGHGNPFVDNGGIVAVTNGDARSLGWEFNLSAMYRYSKDVSTSLLFGWFAPGSAYRGAGFVPAGRDADDAFELRGEVTVNF